jgi:hypothetical protein
VFTTDRANSLGIISCFPLHIFDITVHHSSTLCGSIAQSHAIICHHTVAVGQCVSLFTSRPGTSEARQLGGRYLRGVPPWAACRCTISASWQRSHYHYKWQGEYTLIVLLACQRNIADDDDGKALSSCLTEQLKCAPRCVGVCGCISRHKVDRRASLPLLAVLPLLCGWAAVFRSSSRCACSA